MKSKHVLICFFTPNKRAYRLPELHLMSSLMKLYVLILDCNYIMLLNTVEWSVKGENKFMKN